MDWYLKALRQFADFRGRAQRAEFWGFTLVNMFLGLVGPVLFSVFQKSSSYPLIFQMLSLLLDLWLIGMIIPSVSVSVRRFHDIDKSGWWSMLMIVPLIGFLICLVPLLKEGTLGQNKYGPNPKKGTQSSSSTISYMN